MFIRCMRLRNDGEISSSVVLIITTIKRRGWVGGVFCNMGIVLTGGAMLGVLQCGYCADWGCNPVCSVMWVLC